MRARERTLNPLMLGDLSTRSVRGAHSPHLIWYSDLRAFQTPISPKRRAKSGAAAGGRRTGRAQVGRDKFLPWCGRRAHIFCGQLFGHSTLISSEAQKCGGRRIAAIILACLISGSFQRHKRPCRSRSPPAATEVARTRTRPWPVPKRLHHRRIYLHECLVNSFSSRLYTAFMAEL